MASRDPVAASCLLDEQLAQRCAAPARDEDGPATKDQASIAAGMSGIAMFGCNIPISIHRFQSGRLSVRWDTRTPLTEIYAVVADQLWQYRAITYSARPRSFDAFHCFSASSTSLRRPNSEAVLRMIPTIHPEVRRTLPAFAGWGRTNAAADRQRASRRFGGVITICHLPGDPGTATRRRSAVICPVR